MDQALLFEDEICAARHVIYLRCPEPVLVARLRDRAAMCGRFDDNEDTVRKRLATFHDVALPVIHHYMSQGKVTEVDAEQGVEHVYREVEATLESVGALAGGSARRA